MKILLLGGTGEARRLAAELLPDHDVISSLAGRTRDARLPVGALHHGGFGGVEGLSSWLVDHGIQTVIDATHPFAAMMTAHAAAACSALDLPLLVLRRPGWQQQPGDTWHWTSDSAAAAALLPALLAGGRVFLTIGRQGLAAFAHTGLWTLARCVDPPDPVPTWCELILDRGPYEPAAELELLRTRRIDVLVTKNSGGDMTSAKLAAARELSIPVVLIERPPLPAGVAVARTTGEVRAWLTG
ncbi:cobalt-precorrin-6A reductase [Kribbella sp. CA-293567]|uniref:cobalt-precorrin-6A reductase n=1 Tax=Kribbella sp. CA-293567 TaxID=3002436 RepID=UPI0022DD685F|nr:cobalt-precorrin-6A reductase [Kribbella sp. CA-293567]WBQ07268.1 cobalt-precorrin-6A reductase [Kribbella sp. CA-293567]